MHTFLRLSGVTVGLTTVMFALAGSFYGLAHVRSDYVCLTYWEWFGGGNWMIDGSADLARRYATELRTSPLLPISTSPDERYKAYIRPSDDPASSQSEGALYIQSAATGNSVLVQDGIWLHSGWANVNVTWSPDNQHAGIWWQSAKDNREYITMASTTRADSHLLVAGAQNTALYSWSPNSHYAIVSTPTPDGHVVSDFYAAPDFDHVVYTTQPAANIDVWTWSPSNERFVYTAYTDVGLSFNLVSLPDRRETQVYVPIDRWYTLSESSEPLHRWSADEQFIALPWFAKEGGLHYDIASMDGTIYTDIAGPIWQNYVAYTAPQTIWQRQHFVFAAPLPNMSEGALIDFDTDSGEHRMLAADLREPPFYSAHSGHIALYDRADDGTKAVELVDAFHDAHVPLVEDADDASYPSWSPDGEHLAVIWATGQRTRRVVRLTWANADGSRQHTLEDDFWDVRDLAWLNDGAKLAYVAVRREGESVEVLDMASGERQVLLEDALKVGSIEQNAAGTSFGFWWSLPNGDALGDTFTLEGEHTRRLRALAPANFSQLRVFWSPDRTLAALKLMRADGESLQLATPDGETILVRTGLSGLGDPLWSPDSQRLTFTQSIKRASVTLEVVNRHGRTLTHFDNKGQINELAWSRCG